MDETYNFDEKTEKDEGQDAMDDIDAFEKRMRGEASAKAPAKPLQARVRAPVRRHRLTTHRRATATVLQDNKPKFASKPVKKGSAYVDTAGAWAVLPAASAHPRSAWHAHPCSCSTVAHGRTCLAQSSLRR